MNIDAAASQTHLAHLASARAIVLASQRGSTSLVQRTLKIQYSEAAALLEELECEGVVGPMQFPGGREVLLDVNGKPRCPRQTVARGDGTVMLTGSLTFEGDLTVCNSYYLAAPWIPTVEAVNALPDPLRKYIRDLETLCDPSGIVRDNAQLRDTNAGLQNMYRNAADALGELVACKGLKDHLNAAAVPDDAVAAEYKRRKELAWTVARALVRP